jgi:predicted nucleic acid-binding protein
MDIVLDSNIFVGNFLMGSKKFQLVFDYLKKTNSKIVVPQLVYQEIAGVYERELADRLKKFREYKKSLQIILIGKTIQDLHINFKEEVGEYLKFIKDKLKINDNDIFPYKDEYLKNVIERAIYRIRPCTNKGEGFRDVVLWLTVLDIARFSKNKELIFISNNTRQFSEEGKSLHPVLFKETEEAELQIKYYKSLDHFIESHAVMIDFITTEWLNSFLSLDTINAEIIKMLERSGKKSLLDWVEWHEDKDTTGYSNPISSFVDLDTFYVYEKTDGSYYVEASYYGEVEVEFEFEQTEDSIGLEDEYEYEALGYNFGKTGIKCLCPEIRVAFGVDIVDKKIKNYEITDWEI